MDQTAKFLHYIYERGVLVLINFAKQTLTTLMFRVNYDISPYYYKLDDRFVLLRIEMKTQWNKHINHTAAYIHHSVRACMAFHHTQLLAALCVLIVSTYHGNHPPM